MKHPLEWIPTEKRKPLFWVFLTGTLVVFLLFQPTNRPLMTAAAPNGIVSLQMAGSASNAQAMLDSWSTEARMYAAFGLGFDYLYMPVYALALALGTLLAAGRHAVRFGKLATWAAYAAFLAAGLDGLENLGQFLQVFHGRTDLAGVIAVVATAKFGLILLALAVGVGGALWPRKR